MALRFNLNWLLCIIMGVVIMLGGASPVRAQVEVAWSSGVIEKQRFNDTRVFRVIERQSRNSQERFWIHRLTNELQFEFTHYVDISSFKTAEETRSVIGEENERYNRSHREAGKTAFVIPRNQVEEMRNLFKKYYRWVAILATENLSSDIEKELGSVGKLQFKFRTPAQLVVGDWWLDSTCVTNFVRLMDTLAEMDADAQQQERDNEAARAAEKTQVALKAQAEAKKKVDEERAKQLLK